MKIQSVVANNRKRTFEVHTRRDSFVFPYVKATPTPSADNRIAEVCVDLELGREGFTYRLASGAEGSVHLDAVLEYNEDPSYMAELTLYQLTVEAKERYESSGLSAARSPACSTPRRPSSTDSSTRRTTPSPSGSWFLSSISSEQRSSSR